MKLGLRLSTIQILVIGFALVILIGGALLALPFSNRSGQGIAFIDGLFTATSATCVTGLIVYDTYTQFNFFGQAVILILIQIGGLGFMLVAISFSLFIGRRIGLRERVILADSVSALKTGGIIRLTKKALFLTAAAELSGAVILAFRYIPKFGFWQGLWCGVFQGISAFCNAGFDLLGRIEPYTSLTRFYDDPFVIITTGLLIAMGGLGFFAWDDISEKKLRFSKYHLHTKIMLTGTLFLIIFGTALFYLLESNYSMKDMNVGGRLLSSFFASVTPRTAGFNSVQIASMSEGGTLLTMILMAIGAGPGSTGGGIKVTTVIIVLLGIVARARGVEDLNIYGRRLENGSLGTAATSAGIYLVLVLIGSMILCAQGFHVTDALYEVLSGISTVGLTRGITSTLPFLSKSTIILLMYAGRVGSLAVIMAVTTHKGKVHYLRNVSEKVIIG